MNILLVKLSTELVYGELPSSVQVSLGLACIASVLEEAGYRVTVLDMEIKQVTKNKFAEIIKRTKPEIAGVTSTTPTYLTAAGICEAIKEISPKIITILGGIHANVMPIESLKSSFAGIAVL